MLFGISVAQSAQNTDRFPSDLPFALSPKGLNHVCYNVPFSRDFIRIELSAFTLIANGSHCEKMTVSVRLRVN